MNKSEMSEATPSLFIESRKIKVPYEAIEEAVIQYLEDHEYLTPAEIALSVDLGIEVDEYGLVEVDVDLTWED